MLKLFEPFFFLGNSTLQKKVITSSNKLLILEVTNLVNGSLNLTVFCNGPYTLQVTGSSPLDFTYQLLDVDDLERGTTRRVVGNPLRGGSSSDCFLVPNAVYVS